MGQPRRRLTPDRSPLHLWGSELRAWRDCRNLSLAKMGELIRYNASYLARIERGERKPPRDLAEAADRLLNTSGALLRLWHLIDSNPNEVRQLDHVASSPGHVAKPHEVLASEPDPGGSEEVGIAVPCRTQNGRIIFVILPRRRFLSDLDLVPMAALAAGPSSSTQPKALGSPPAIMAPDLKPAEHFRQMRRALIANDNLLGPFRTIPAVVNQIDAIRQLRQSCRGADARELLYIQTQYAELCGWLYEDARDFRSSQFWTDRALEWSYAAGAPDLTTFVLARKSQLAGDMNDGLTAVDLADAAVKQARPDTRLGAIAATHGAYGYALATDIGNANRMLDLAHDLITNHDMDPAFSWGSWMDDAYIEAHRARCLYTVGEYSAAAEKFRTAVENLPRTYHRDRGVHLARKSLAHVGAGEPEQAADTGRQALAIAQTTGSARIITGLIRLDEQLARWHSIPAVAEFRESFDELIAHQA
ncbi:helix-turn-helix transcriptional regulator [Nonomuraea angiospora]|uniref:helix-turn-helix domain-containing protein n=1 Tax=Nonomuraea angiospora TaxID=46172 RepID=UPI0034478842